jgi:hypothetical protein
MSRRGSIASRHPAGWPTRFAKLLYHPFPHKARLFPGSARLHTPELTWQQYFRGTVGRMTQWTSHLDQVKLEDVEFIHAGVATADRADVVGIRRDDVRVLYIHRNGGFRGDGGGRSICGSVTSALENDSLYGHLQPAPRACRKPDHSHIRQRALVLARPLKTIHLMASFRRHHAAKTTWPATAGQLNRRGMPLEVEASPC